MTEVVFLVVCISRAFRFEFSFETFSFRPFILVAFSLCLQVVTFNKRGITEIFFQTIEKILYFLLLYITKTVQKNSSPASQMISVVTDKFEVLAILRQKFKIEFISESLC